MKTLSPQYSHFPQHIETLIDSALSAVEPGAAVRRCLQRNGQRLVVGATEYDLGEGDVYLVGAGKASVKMGKAASSILGDCIKEGILITKDVGDVDSPPVHEKDLSELIAVFEASHPVSDSRGVEATDAVQKMLAGTTSDDLVLCLISGGASALLTRPLIPLTDWQQLTNTLLASGCTINELNAVRRQIDSVKGGGLLAFATPASCASLILSDVIGNPLEVIGSGPTVVIEEDAQDARDVLKRYEVSNSLATEVWNRVERALNEVEEEAPIHPRPANNCIIGDIRQAATSAESTAKDLGFNTHLLTCHLEGEAREVGKVAAAMAKDAEPGTCLILGGETTVTLRGDGSGGRNQELILSAAIVLDEVKSAVVFSFATDGEDGPTKSAGAYATGFTYSDACQNGLDPQTFLANNDSNAFFARTGGLLNTGSTGTNVNDLLFVLRYEA